MITTKDIDILSAYFDNIYSRDHIEIIINDNIFAPFIEKDNILTVMPNNFPRENRMSLAILKGNLILCRPSFAGNATTILNCMTNQYIEMDDDACISNLRFLGEIIKITY